MPTDHLDMVREIATSMMLVDEGDRLREMDSLMVVEFLTALEARTQITIPVGSIQQEMFQSVESIAAVLTDLATA